MMSSGIVEFCITESGNDLPSVQCEDITWTNADLQSNL